MFLPNQPPSWVLPGAYFHFDFANGRYWSKAGGCMHYGSAIAASNLTSPAFLVESNSGADAAFLLAVCRDGIVRSPVVGGSQFYFPIINDYGLWVQGSVLGGSTNANFNLWCRDLTNAAYTKVNMSAALNQTGANNAANTASLITATAPLATILQTQLGGPSTQYVGSAWVKRVSGSGAVSITIDGVTFTDISVSINSTTYTQISCAAQTLTNVSVGFRISVSGDSVAVDFLQLENNDVPTMPMYTAGSSTGRAPEEPFGANDGTTNPANSGQNIINRINSGHPAAVYVKYAGNFSANNAHNIYGDSNNGILILGAANGTNTVQVINAISNSVATTNTENIGWQNPNKIITNLNGKASGMSVCLNGGPIATANGTFSAQQPLLAHYGFGNRGAGDRPLNGYIAEFAAWDKEITQGQMIQYTK